MNKKDKTGLLGNLFNIFEDYKYSIDLPFPYEKRGNNITQSEFYCLVTKSDYIPEPRFSSPFCTYDAMNANTKDALSKELIDGKKITFFKKIVDIYLEI